MTLKGNFFRFLSLFLFACLLANTAQAQEIRGFWVDTFNTNLNTPADVSDVVNRAVSANANAVFVQVRRRGDAFYISSYEPSPNVTYPPTNITAGFDPLADLLVKAHGAGLQVHAFFIANAIWNRSATVPPLPTADHVFYKHGWNYVTSAIYSDSRNWLTRSLAPELQTAAAVMGYRFGSDYWQDPGHPDAAAYTVDVVKDLVTKYDIDGLHLDRIRYPDFSAAGQTPSGGTSIGYNPTSVARFLAKYPGKPNPPLKNDPEWNQWRRDQVSNLVRRIYLEATAIRPKLVVSAALIVYGGFSTWPAAEAYWRVYQDWRAWLDEGIIDIAIPMNYKREHASAEVTMFDGWNTFIKDNQYNRGSMIGTGIYLNGVEGTLRQVRRALSPSAAGNSVLGVNLYAMASPDTAFCISTNKGTNPFSYPTANICSPAYSFADFAGALTTGKSANGNVTFENPLTNPVAVFATPATPPALPWKEDPKVGHLKGTVHDENANVVDAGAIAIARVDDGTIPAFGRTTINSATDGNGFYGGVDLAPGSYRVSVTPNGAATYTMQCTTSVVAGQVGTFDFTIDRTAPTSTVAVTPDVLWPANNKSAEVTVSGAAADTGTGLASVSFSVEDEYGTVQPEVAAVPLSAMEASWSQTFPLEAARRGDDRDGRVYTVHVTVTDRACNTTNYTATVVVPHDQRK